MNILVLHAHDAGRFVQPYGYAVNTPRLQRFAEESVLFRKAFCVSPTCGPSRSAMLSGQYPHECGVLGLPGFDGWEFDDYDKHLVHVLNQAGYQTALAGCQHECDGRDLSPLQYERILNDPSRERRGWFYSDTIDRVEEFLAEEHDRPFFLSVGIDEPHRNNIGREELGIGAESARFSKTRYYDPEKLDARYTAPPPWLPDLPEVRRDMASFCRGVELMDEYMGRVLDAIEHYGFKENTLVIVTTDHGIEFQGAKKTLSDQGTGVMLMMRAPGRFKGGRVIESIVSHLDVYPTLMEMLNLSPSHSLSGKSLLPLLTGESDVLHDEVFTEQTYHGYLEAMRAVRTERYKLVLRHPGAQKRMACDGPTAQMLEDIGWMHKGLEQEQLYDLYLDPLEARPVQDLPEYAVIREDLRGRLNEWMAQTGDCFPSGNFPPIPREAQQTQA